ncbi:ATP-dependent Clp protease proteolytic subunit [Candidatus Poribacteria bacterium]|nr:ATP-dependent Clp protease proteolytic subunit [Candidatus Poribacteria bacterium]
MRNAEIATLRSSCPRKCKPVSESLPREILAGIAQLHAQEPATRADRQPVCWDDDDVYYIPVPRVFEQTDRGERIFDLYSRLLLDRIILINREFDDRLANLVAAQLLFLQSQDADKPINIYINSPGGVISSGMAIYDTMQHVKPEVSTTVIGEAASMGAVILLAGARGKRFALPNARIMIHQPSGGAQGTSIDLEIQTEEMIRVRQALYRVMADHTGHTPEEIAEACRRDRFMTPEEALEFGIIDEILRPKKPGATPAKDKA